ASATAAPPAPPRPRRRKPPPPRPRRPRYPPVRPASPGDPASARSFALQGLVLQVLVMKLVAELVAFRGEVARVLLRRRRLDLHRPARLEREPPASDDRRRDVRAAACGCAS